MSDIRDDCAACCARLAAWAGDATTDADRRAVTTHVAGCDACRNEAMAVDPALMFATLRGGPLPGRFWENFNEGLKSRIAAETARPAPVRLVARLADFAAGLRDAVAWAPARAIWAAPALMVMVLGVTVAVLRHDILVPGLRPPQGEALRSPYEPPGKPVRPGSLVSGANDARRDGRRPPGVLPALASGTGDPPALEEVASPSARVYRFDAADGHAAPIYFVVDESIEF
jgi:hypothetical protein